MVPVKIPDKELIARCVSGKDPRAWEDFVRTYSKLIWSSINRAFRSSSFHYCKEDVEDVYASLFLSLLENQCKKLRLFQSRNACTLSTWLAVVAVRRTIDYMRHHGRYQLAGAEADLFETIADHTPNVEAILMKEQQKKNIEKILSDLPASDKELFTVLRDTDLKPVHAARALGISVASFYTRKHRLIEKIKKTE